MEPSTFPQLVAYASLGRVAVLVAFLTSIRAGLLYKAGRTRRAFAEMLEAAIIAVVLLFFVIQPFFGKTFYIPSGSMLPTLVDNDHIIVNKLIYRFTAPTYGSVVVFVAPQRAIDEAQDPPDYGQSDGADDPPVDYIKRVIGLPGDIVVVQHGYVDVGGYQETHADIRRALDLTDPNGQHVKIEPSDLLITNGSVTRYNAAQVAQLFSDSGAPVTFHPGETIRNGVVLNEPYTAEDPSYDFKLVGGHSCRVDADGEIEFDGAYPNIAEKQLAYGRSPGPVPQGQVLVMGDNRNDSHDSTVWGPLDMHNLVGRAIAIFWPMNRMRKIN
jgi:signal peptidase I